MSIRRAPYSTPLGIAFFDENNFIVAIVPPRKTQDETEEVADRIQLALEPINVKHGKPFKEDES